MTPTTTCAARLRIALNRDMTSPMAVHITVRDVPEAVRDELADRAARANKSMQVYLRDELERPAARPSIDQWLEQVRGRVGRSGTHKSTEDILRHLDAVRGVRGRD